MPAVPAAASASPPETATISGSEIDTENRSIFDPAQGRPAAGSSLVPLTKRADFLAAQSGRKVHTKGFVLCIRARDDDGPARVGFTCSRKVGNAVARNRARRRLREAARHVLADAARPGHDYVLIGRKDATADRPFQLLLDDLRRAMAEAHR